MVRLTGPGLLGDITRVGVVLGVSVAAACLIAATLEDAYIVAAAHGYAIGAADARSLAQFETEVRRAATVQPKPSGGLHPQALPCVGTWMGPGSEAAARATPAHGQGRGHGHGQPR